MSDTSKTSVKNSQSSWVWASEINNNSGVSFGSSPGYTSFTQNNGINVSTGMAVSSVSMPSGKLSAFHDDPTSINQLKDEIKELSKVVKQITKIVPECNEKDPDEILVIDAIHSLKNRDNPFNVVWYDVEIDGWPYKNCYIWVTAKHGDVYMVSFNKDVLFKSMFSEFSVVEYDGPEHVGFDRQVKRAVDAGDIVAWAFVDKPSPFPVAV